MKFEHELHDYIVSYIKSDVNAYNLYAKPWQDKAEACHLLEQGNIDWSHKEDFQAKISLNKMGLAKGQLKAGVKRGLMKWDDWLEVEERPLYESKLLLPFEAKRMLEILNRDADIKVFVADTYGDGFFENLVCSKIEPCVSKIIGPKGKEYESPRLKYIRRDIWTYGTDPDHKDVENQMSLFEFDICFPLKYKLARKAHSTKKEYSRSKPYIKSQIELLSNYTAPQLEEQDQYDNVRSDVEITPSSVSQKPKVKVVEYYGTILDEDGMPLEYVRKRDGKKMILENVRVTLGNDELMIEEPTYYHELFFDGLSPFIRHRIHRSKHHILGKAPGHAGYELARILNELASAAADAAMKASNQLIGVVMENLENPEAISNGIAYDTVLKFNQGTDIRSQIVSLSQGSLPPEFFSVQGFMESAIAENLQKSQIGLAGALPNKEVKATELVSSNQVVNSLEDSDLMDFEDVYLEKFITKQFHYGLQMADRFHDLDLEYIFADRGEQRDAAIKEWKKAAKNPEKLFKELAFAFRFRGRGLKGIMQAARKGQVYGNLLNVAMGNDIVREELNRGGYSIPLLMDEWLKSMEIDPEAIKDPNVAFFAKTLAMARAAGEGAARAMGNQQAQTPGAQAAPGVGGIASGNVEPGNNGMADY